MKLPNVLAASGVAVLVGMVAASTAVLPGVHATQMRGLVEQAQLDGVPEAPAPNIPGRLDGQGVGQERNENRDVQVAFWKELGDGGDGSKTAATIERRGGGKDHGGKGRGRKGRRDDGPAEKLDPDGPQLDPAVNPPMHDADKPMVEVPRPTAVPVQSGPKFIPVPELQEGQPEVLYEGGARPDFDQTSRPPEHDPASEPPQFGDGWVPLHDHDREGRQ